MQFKVNDLMIVVPEQFGEDELLAGCTVSCGDYGCTRPASKKCDPGTCKITVCNAPTKLPTQPFGDFLPDYAESLAALKDQLRVQMAAVEAQEQFIQQQMGPQSLEEVEQIEKALRGAMAELEKQKQKLQAGGKKPAPKKPK